MPAGQVQLAAKGLQDEYFSGTPQMSFFNTMFYQHTPFFLKAKEIPVNNSRIGFSSSQICEIKRNGDIVKSITIKITLPSMFISGEGLCYPDASTFFEPKFYFLTADYTVLYTFSTKNSVLYYNTLNQTWLPPFVQINSDKFSFSRPSNEIVYIAFTNTTDALFWGFKNEKTFINGFYIYDFKTMSDISFLNSGWINSNYPYFRYYKNNAALDIIDSVDLYIGGQLIESVPSEYMKIYNDINIENNQQESIINLIGDRQTPSTSDVEYFIKVPFSSENIPVCALTRHTIEVRIQIKDFLGVVDSNAYNVSQFSNSLILGTTTDISARGALFDGTYDYILHNNSIKKVFSNLSTKIETNFPVPSGITNMIMSRSNIYLLNKTSLIQYNTLSNTSTNFDIGKSNCYSNTVSLLGTPIGLFNYTNQNSIQIITNKSVRSYDFPFSNILSTFSLNDTGYISTGKEIIVQSLVTPYVTTSNTIVVNLYGTAKQFSATLNSVYYITNTHLITYKNTIFSIVSLLTTSPNTLTSYTDAGGDKIVVFYGTSVSIFSSGSVFTADIGVEVLDCVYNSIFSTPTIIISLKSGGLARYTVSTNKVDLAVNTGTTVYDKLVISSSFIYCYSKIDNKILQVSISSSWPPVVSPTVPVTISGNPFLAIDSTTSRLYYSGSNNDSLFFGNDSTGFVQNTFQNVPLNFSGLSNIFYNGNYIFAFPENGTSTIYRYNTAMNIKINSSHSYYELLDSSGNPKPIFNGTLNTDGYRIISFPTILDSNIIMYNTLNPFTEQFSYFIYSFDGLITPYNYLFSSVYKSNIYVASNSVVQTFITTAGGTSQFTSTIATKSIGSAYNGTNTSFVFNNNPSSVNYYTVDLNNNDSLVVTQPTVNPFSKLGTYSSVIQQGSDVYLTPNNHTNISVFSLTTRLVTDYSVPSAVANFTNTACIANSVLYMFPSNAHTNTWAFNIQTKTVSNINTSQNDYRSSTYDGKKYIYLTNPIGNIIRFDTSLENFTDFSGYTRSSPPARFNYVSTTISSLGNVYIANTNSIIRTNVATGQVGNLFVNFTTIPKISRQTDGANVIYITNSTNLFRFSTNTFTTANLLQTYLLDRTNSSSKTVTDITANGLSNVYISWSDNTLGYFNFSSNDFSGIYNAAPLTGAAPSGTITTSTALNGNIYTLTNETVSRTNLFTSTSILNIKIQDTLAIGATPINNYSTLFTFKSNVYMFPLNGNVIGKYSESVALTNSNIDRQRTNVTNITSVTSVNDYIYCASKTSGNLFEYDTTRDFRTLSNFTVYALPNPSANGFSNSWYNSTDNSVYFLPYRSNIIMSYNTGVQSFGNNAIAFSRSTMIEPNVVSSSIISTSTSALLTDNGYILPVVNGIFQDSNKFIDSVQKRNRFRYEVVPGYAYNTMGFVRDWYLNLNGAPRGPSTIGTTNVLLPGQYEPFKVTAYMYIREPGEWNVTVRMGFGSIVWISKLLNQTDLNESSLTYFNADINDTKFFRVYIDLSSFIAIDVNNNRVSGINIEYLYVNDLNQVITLFPTLVPTTIIRAGPFRNIVNILNKDTVTLTLNAQDRLEFRIGTAAGYSPSGLSYVVSGMRSLNFSVDAFSVTESGVPNISEPIGLFFDRRAGGSKDIIFPQSGMYRYIAFLGSGSPGNQDKSGLAYAKKSDAVYYVDTYYSDPGDWRNLPPASNIFVDYTQNPSLYYFDLSPIIPVINNGYVSNFNGSAITKINNDGTVGSSYSPILRDGNANFKKFVVTPNNIYFYDSGEILFYDSDFYGFYNSISIYNIQSKTSDWTRALVTNTSQNGTNYNAYQICFFNGLLYCLSGTDSISKMFLIQDGGYIAVQNDIIAPHNNVYSSNVSFSLDDGVCFVQSGPLGSNINGINSQSCISYDYVLKGTASSPQQYSCVISVNNLNYLSPSNGSVIIRINTRSTLTINDTTSISNFDISTISQLGVGTYTVYGSSDLLSNVFYSVVNKSSGATHVIKYDATQDFTISSSWIYYGLMPTITSQTAVYNFSSKRLLIPSSTNNTLIQQPVAVSTVNPYKQTVYNIPSILSNICQVYNSVAYMYPGIGAPTNTIVSYNFNSSSFAYTQHDAVVYDFIIIEPNYHILINQNKINIFSTSSFTSLGNFGFPNSSGLINGKAYDGRYLNIFTGSGTVQFDFSEGLNKLSRPITNGVSNIFYSAVNLDGNLYASNNIVYTRLGYQPRGYYEISSAASGLITQSNNLYAKVGSSIVVYNSNLTTSTQLITTLSSRPAIDSVFVNSNLVFLTTDYVSSYNVFTRTTQFNTLKNDEYASELLVDNSNIFVPSVTNLNLIRVTNTGALSIATGADIIENPVGTRFVNSYYENSNLVMTTDQNILYTYNRFRPSFYITTMGFSNVYHSTILNNKIYYFPGSNAVSNVVMVYDTTKPFFSNSSYSNIFVDLADIRSSVTVGNSIRGIGYNSNSIYIIDTLNNVLSSKIFIDSTQNMSSNNYLYPIYDRKSYILTPANSTATTLRRIYEVPFLSKASFGNPILLNEQFSINGLIQNGSTLYVISSNVFSMDVNLPPPSILSATTPLYSSTSPITASLFDGRFLKLITNRVVYYDTLPLTIPQTLLISCIVNYAYLTRREQAWLQKNTLDYIVTQIQRSSIVLNKTKGYYKLNFTGPTKEFMFTLNRGSLNFVELFINGHSKSKLGTSYISDTNNYLYHKRSPTSTNVYTYSLCLDPLSNKSSGYLNASRVAEQIMYIDVTSLGTLSVWALSHNILRIRDGLGGIMFNARDR